MSGLEGLLTGRTLVKRYLIQEVIGRGGFAAVYRAQDERLGRPVAVKVITYPAPDAETRDHLRERFQREARATASFPQHPNVVTVHDFGTDPQLGLDFLVMELLDGDNLSSYLEQNGRPPLDRALRILRDAAEGLCIGHRAGLVHRDVKPGNIFLARQGSDHALRVCILDFGIAQVLAEENVSTRLTKTGFMPHSPAYASPEQMRGETDLTAATDVFSLGVVGYQLFTGEKPFAGEKRLDPADWVPGRAVREINPEVPPALEAVLLRAMSYDPAARFADAGEMAAAMSEALEAEDRTALAAAPLVVAPAVEDDRTLLHAEAAAAPPPPPASTVEPLVVPPPRSPSRPAAPPARSSSARTWAVAALVGLLLGAAGLWALTRNAGPGGEKETEPAVVATDSVEQVEEVVVEDISPGQSGPLGAGAAAPAGGGEVGTGAAAAPPAEGGAIVTAPAVPQPGAAPARTAPATGLPQPPAPPSATRPVPTQPAPARPAPARPAPAQPAPTPARPAPAQPAPAQPTDTARRTPPRLLGRPVERRPPPDTTRRDSTTAAVVG